MLKKKNPLFEGMGLAPVGFCVSLSRSLAGVKKDPMEAFLQSHKDRLWAGFGHGR